MPAPSVVWEATSEAIALSDPAAVVLTVNPAYCALYGFPSETLIGQSFAVILPAAARAAARQQYQAIFADPAPSASERSPRCRNTRDTPCSRT